MPSARLAAPPNIDDERYWRASHSGETMVELLERGTRNGLSPLRPVLTFWAAKQSSGWSLSRWHTRLFLFDHNFLLFFRKSVPAAKSLGAIYLPGAVVVSGEAREGLFTFSILPQVPRKPGLALSVDPTYTLGVADGALRDTIAHALVRCGCVAVGFGRMGRRSGDGADPGDTRVAIDAGVPSVLPSSGACQETGYEAGNDHNSGIASISGVEHV